MKSNRLFWLPFSICAGPLFIWLFLVPKLLWSFEPFDTSESGYIDPPIPNTVVIAVNLGNIRESPSQSSPIKYKLQKGDTWNSDIRIKKNASFFKNIELTVFRLYFHNPIRMGRRMHSRRAGQRSHTDAKGGICKKTKRDYG